MRFAEPNGFGPKTWREHAARNGRWKLIERHGVALPAQQLFDLSVDPFEQHNLWPAETAEELAAVAELGGAGGGGRVGSPERRRGAPALAAGRRRGWWCGLGRVAGTVTSPANRQLGFHSRVSVAPVSAARISSTGMPFCSSIASWNCRSVMLVPARPPTSSSCSARNCRPPIM